jgi:aminopeptidase N
MSPIPPPSDAFEGDPYLPTSGNVGYGVEHYEIDLDYRVASNRLTANVVITATATQDLARLSLDVAGLIVDRVTIDGERPKKVTSTARKLLLVPAAPIPAGARFEVVVRYHGTPHPLRSEWGEVGWEELADGVLVASQPNGASTWFPCNDHPSDKATYDITVVCESAYDVLANGRLVTKTASASRTRWTFAVVEPMATYLATVQIGRYRPRALPGVTVHAPVQLQRQSDVDFAPVARMREVFEELFGPYPFDDYSVVVTADVLEIPLEAHGMAIFGRNHVDGAHGDDRLIAHELAHQWFGNSLTVSRWQHIWLHEGFACYAEWLWSEANGGSSAHELALRHLVLLGQQPRDIVVGDPGPRLLFDDRVYKRGALGLHAVRREIGDAEFFGALRSLTERLRFGHVEPHDVVAAFSAAPGGEGVRQLIQRWIYEKALPSLR